MTPPTLTQVTSLNNTASPAAQAYASNPRAGSTLFCSVGWDTTAGTPVVSDNVGGTWAQVGTTQTSGAHNFAVYRCLSAIGGATTVTATLAGATFSLCISEFSTVNASNGVVAGAVGSFPSVAVVNPSLVTFHLGVGGDSVLTTSGSPGSWTDDFDSNLGPTSHGLSHTVSAGGVTYTGSGTVGGGTTLGVIIGTTIPPTPSFRPVTHPPRPFRPGIGR